MIIQNLCCRHTTNQRKKEKNKFQNETTAPGSSLICHFLNTPSTHTRTHRTHTNDRHTTPQHTTHNQPPPPPQNPSFINLYSFCISDRRFLPPSWNKPGKEGAMEGKGRARRSKKKPAILFSSFVSRSVVEKGDSPFVFFFCSCLSLLILLGSTERGRLDARNACYRMLARIRVLIRFCLVGFFILSLGLGLDQEAKKENGNSTLTLTCEQSLRCCFVLFCFFFLVSNIRTPFVILSSCA
jgi:hypothetical protein